MKKLALYFILFSLAGCTTQPKSAPTKPSVLYRYSMNENIVQLAHTTASYYLKDPESAKFRDTFFLTSDDRGEARDRSKDSWYIEINGKNSYGAYAGYTWALLPAGGKSVIMGSSPTGAIAGQLCSSAIYPPA
ncbi:hypothetical protein EQV97_22290 [Pseudomonas sp. TMW22090]|uniref:hypothetical protein n=1 Tax=Pseudomonas sp. TMW22090 TaxID=2506434 RepID=UPI001F11870D|nr:hypothetical protein [Pseudomonas sp. TMW22090]MCH4880092.1 hypothetical protein [Pseudomonas sp. TMW22090]